MHRLIAQPLATPRLRAVAPGCVSLVAFPSPCRRVRLSARTCQKTRPGDTPSPGRHKFRGRARQGPTLVRRMMPPRFARRIFHAAFTETLGAARRRHPIEEGSVSLTRRRGVGPIEGSAAHATPANAACLCASRQGLSAGFPRGAQGCPSGARRIACRPGGSVPLDGENSHCRQKRCPSRATVSNHAATGREERSSRAFAPQPD